MIDVVALGEVLIDFASRGTDANGYPLMQALPGGPDQVRQNNCIPGQGE